MRRVDTISHRQRILHRTFAKYWARFWMIFSGTDRLGRFASRLATWFAPPHKSRVFLARLSRKGYISPSAVIHHANLRLGANVFMDDRVVIYQREHGGCIELGDGVYVYRDSILETGYGGTITIGRDSSIHPRCQLNAYLSPIQIGQGVMIAPNCAFYPYDHGLSPEEAIRRQQLTSKGGITIGNEAWLAFGVIVLGGVRIGNGAAVAAGSVVTRDIPDGAIAAGAPARVIKMRSDLTRE